MVPKKSGTETVGKLLTAAVTSVCLIHSPMTTFDDAIQWLQEQAAIHFPNMPTEGEPITGDALA
jgi:hypothetical protein